jgi:hypothetical protein
MANIIWLINDSTASKKGSPSPTGIFDARHSIIPPT